LKRIVKREELSGAFDGIFDSGAKDLAVMINIFGENGSGKSSFVNSYLNALEKSDGYAVFRLDVGFGDICYPETGLLALRNDSPNKIVDKFEFFDIAYLARSEKVKGKLNKKHVDFFKKPSSIINKIVDDSGTDNHFLRSMYRSIDNGEISAWYESVRDVMLRLMEEKSYKNWESLIFIFGKCLREIANSGLTPVVFIDNAENLFPSSSDGTVWMKEVMDVAMSGFFIFASADKLDDSVFGKFDHFVPCEGMEAIDSYSLFHDRGLAREALQDQFFEATGGSPAFLDYSILTYEILEGESEFDVSSDMFESDRTSIVHLLLSLLGSSEAVVAKMLSAGRFFDSGLFDAVKREFLNEYEFDEISLVKFSKRNFVDKIADGIYRIHPSFGEEALKALDSDAIENVNNLFCQYHMEMIEDVSDYMLRQLHIKEAIHHGVAAMPPDVFLKWFLSTEAEYFSPEFFNFWLDSYKTVLQKSIDVMGGCGSDVGILFDKSAYMYMLSSNFAGAEKVLKARLEAVEEKHGKNTPETVPDMNKLAEAYGELGDYSAAEAVMKKGLEIREDNYGDKDVDTADSYLRLGKLYKNKGDKRGAVELVEKADKIISREKAQEDIFRIEAEEVMADVYVSSGELAKAVQVFKRLAGVKAESMGEFSREAISGLNDYASVTIRNGQFKRAVTLYEELVERSRKAYGDKTPHTASAENDLAMAYQKNEEFDKSENMYTSALKIKDTIYGQFHPSTATSITNFGQLKYAMGDISGAEPYYKKALNVYQTVFGENHKKTASAYNNMGFITSRLGRFEKAEVFYRKSLDIKKSIEGDTSVGVAFAMNNLGDLLFRMDKLNEAKELFSSARDIYKEKYGAEHRFTKITEKNLASIK